MKTGYMVCDAMTKIPVTISSKATIQECAKIMRKEHVGSLLIKDTVLKGLITDEDIVHEVIAKGIDPKKSKVHEHMITKLITISPEEDLFDAVKIMTDKNIKQLPVMDGKKMIGLLTWKDVMKIEPELFDLMVDKLNVKTESHKALNDGICQECGNYSPRLVIRDGAAICKECAKH
ncbi:CBS domain-containing protein [Candidatus Woesearchaeota archaeon]|nr:CBS domain-containing protein [Candidatus Woesearchaeota archaeon]